MEQGRGPLHCRRQRRETTQQRVSVFVAQPEIPLVRRECHGEGQHHDVEERKITAADQEAGDKQDGLALQEQPDDECRKAVLGDQRFQRHTGVSAGGRSAWILDCQG